MVHVKTVNNIKKNGKFTLTSVNGKLNKILIKVKKNTPETSIKIITEYHEIIVDGHLTPIVEGSPFIKFQPVDFNEIYMELSTHYILNGTVLAEIQGLPDDNAIEYVKFFFE